MGDPEIPVSRKLPETVRRLARSREMSDETMLVALMKKSGVHEFYVFYDEHVGEYVARLVRRTVLHLPKRVRYVMFVKELSDHEEALLRRQVRAELGIRHVGGLNSLDPKPIAALIAAF